MSRRVSDSGISVSDKSTSEFSTSGVSLKTDRSKSPVVYFRDERVSRSELVSAWLNQMEIRRIEFLDAEEEPWEQVSFSEEKSKLIAMLLHDIGDKLSDDEEFHKMLESVDAEYNRRRWVIAMPLLGAVGLVTIMGLLRG